MKRFFAKRSWRSNADLASVAKAEMRFQKGCVATNVVPHVSFSLAFEGQMGLGPYLANTLADLGAGVQACPAQRAPEEIKETNKWRAIAFNIARRIAVIEAVVRKREP